MRIIELGFPYRFYYIFLHIEAETKWLLYVRHHFFAVLLVRWMSTADIPRCALDVGDIPNRTLWIHLAYTNVNHVNMIGGTMAHEEVSIYDICALLIPSSSPSLSSNHDHHYHHYTYNYHHSLYHLWVLVAIFHGRNSDFFDFHCQL